MPPGTADDAVWVDVLPSMRGFATSMVKEAAGAGRKAGQAATKELSSATRGMGRDMAENITDGLAQAKAEVEKVSAALVAARDKEADAAGKVRVAEAQLQAVRAKSSATDAQKIAAEERLGAAQRRLEAAQRVTVGTTARLDQAQAAAAARTKALGDESARSERIMVRLAGSIQRIDTSRVDTGVRSLLRFGTAASGAATQAVALGSAAPLIAGLAAAAGQAAGAALVLPGAFIAGGVAAGVLKLGLSGIADAVKEWDDPEKFAEAIKDLSPAGRAAAVAIRDLRPELIELRNLTQEGLLKGTSDEINTLAKVYLPLLRGELPLIAEQFGKARSDAAEFAATGRTVDDVRAILGGTRQSVSNLTGATVPLLAAFRDVGAVGVAVMTDLTMGADTATADFAAFIAQARASGQLDAWIRTGLDTLQDFGAVFAQVGAIINTVLGAAREQGGSVLDTLLQLTGAVLAMLQSVQGQQALAVFFSTVRQVVEALLPGVQALAGALLAGIIAIGPQLPAIAVGLSTAAVALAPLVVDLANLASNILPPLAALLTWLGPALPVIAAGFLAGYVALKAYAIVATIVGFYRAWIAAQVALNVAMSLNPVAIIVVAIAALVGAFIFLWNHSEGFRNFWLGLWESIKTAALWVWENALKPAFDGIVAAVRWVGDAAVWLADAAVTAWRAIGTAASWLWETILKPVFEGIWLAARIAAAILITVFVTPAVLAFKLLAAIGMWLWENVLKYVFEAIGAAASWLWNNVLSPVIGYVIAYVQAWGAIFSWLWTNAISPALAAIGTAFSWLWTNVLMPVVDFIVAAIKGWGLIFEWLWVTVIQPIGTAIGVAVTAVGNAFVWAWNNLIKPAWDALGAAISWVWENVLRPVFDAVKSAVGAVGEAFGAAVDFIKTAWDRVYDILSAPIKWVIDVVYNDGIRAVWNKVAGLVGLGELAPINFGGTAAGGGGPMRHMAHGGVLPGYAPGVDSIPVLASPGEGWLVPEAVRGLGAGFVGWANRYFSGGRSDGGVGTGGPAGFSQGGVVQRFADGGIVGNLLNWVSGIGDDIIGLWKDPIGFIKAQIGATGWADLVARAPGKLIGSGADWLWGKVKGFFGFSSDEAAVAAGAAGGSPMGWQQMWNIIRAQFPSATLNSAFRPGDPGYHGKGRAIDIGGPMGAINSWIAKVYPNSTQLIYTPGANILNGRPFTYDGPTQADHHDHVHWAFDSGGYLPPGYSTVYNGTGRPEPVLTDQQWRSMESAGSGGGRITGELAISGDGLTAYVDGRIERYDQDSADALLRGTRI